jgi:hypothetical protein
MKRNSVNYKSVLSLFLPKGILDYFEIVDFSDMGSYYIICLDELPAIPEEYSSLPLVSKGFYPEIVVTDFPARDHTVCLKLRRRRWEDKRTGKTYSRDWQLVASGTRITAEFGAFLKGILGKP